MLVKKKVPPDYKNETELVNKEEILKQLGENRVLPVITYSVLITIILEILSRRSIIKSLEFILVNPLMFLFNVLIILFTLSFTLMLPRRNFFLVLFSFLWLGLGVADVIILCFRTTPLTAMDFYLFQSVKGVFNIHFNSIQMILIIVVITIVLITMVFLWKRSKKTRIYVRTSLITMAVTAFLMLLISSIALKINALSNEFGNLPDAYANYGFAYCFSNSVFDRGIRKPNNYSKEKIEMILNEINKKPSDFEGNNNFHPNIIMVQLESFFDVNDLLNITFSENPIPYFTELKKEHSSGTLTVPVFGAGTVNTEFEVLTGMNTDFFGTGEYPYRTILKSTTSESICYDLAELGYRSYAIHNNTATFYDRKDVLGKLGFDNFDSIEYMLHTEFNELGWARDKVLTNEIQKALKAGTEGDFIYTISVQPHGKYPDHIVDDNLKIKVTESPEDAFRIPLEYYINQLSETDQFIESLTKALSNYSEPTIVLFFGDHLPPLPIENKDLKNHNKFQTEYVLWSNFPMDKVNKNLKAYQLSAYLMERLGYRNGILTKLHQSLTDHPDYQKNLKLIQYDMLYGNRYVYGGTNPFVEKSLRLGIIE